MYTTKINSNRNIYTPFLFRFSGIIIKLAPVNVVCQPLRQMACRHATPIFPHAPPEPRPRDSRRSTQVRRWLRQNRQKAGDEGIILKRQNGTTRLSL